MRNLEILPENVLDLKPQKMKFPNLLQHFGAKD